MDDIAFEPFFEFGMVFACVSLVGFDVRWGSKYLQEELLKIY